MTEVYYDPDRWASRKNKGELRDIAHPERSIRSFRAKVEIEKIIQKEKRDVEGD